MKLIPLVYIVLFATLTHATEIQPFEATFDVIRGGKVTGKQSTLLEKISENKWSIKDSITGTSGMASFIGFKRTETTEFEYKNNELIATHHEMNQKAAFSKKTYTFNWQADKSQFSINHKNQTSQFDPKDKKIISTQLMPLALALAACNQKNEVKLWVLKNNAAKPYQFKISNSDKLTADRVYNEGQTKSSKTLLDPNKQCLPIEQSHQDGDKPQITTKLISFKWL